MATRRKSNTRKSKTKRSQVRTKPRQKALARAASRNKKMAARKHTVKRTARKRSVPQSRRPNPVVKDTIIDVIDEPMPGVVRVTEIEEVSVEAPEEGKEE